MNQLWKELGREKRGNPTSPRSDQKMLKVTSCMMYLQVNASDLEDNVVAAEKSEVAE